MKVLIVDDDPVAMAVVKRTLAHTGYEVMTVDNGPDAFEIIRNGVCRLVIMDWAMPRMSGIELCRAIRAADLPGYVYVILLTAHDGAEEKIRGLTAGADDFIVKPFNRAELLARVKTGERMLAAELADLRAEIVDRKRAEEASRDSEERFRQIAENIREVFWIMSPDGSRLIYASPACQDLWGHSAAELYENPHLWFEAIHPEDRGRVRSAFASRATDGQFAEEYRIVQPDGVNRWIWDRGFPVRNPSGEVYRIAGIAEDVTDRKRAEQLLLEHQKGLEKSNRQLSELYHTAQRFVDNVSHEFRTPLTVIKGYAEALGQGLAGPVSQPQEEFLGLILDRTRDLAQMVDDMLDSSKLRAGTLRVDRRPHQVSQIFSQVRTILAAKAAANRIELIEDWKSDLPEVFADAEKAGRVIVNLAVNAIKFSPAGARVMLWARPTAEGDVRIGVSDQGPGITPEHLKTIFQRFHSEGASQQSTAKGFGLGLNIARELAALNLGQMSVESEPGQGSTFSFTLPPNDPAVVLERYLTYLHSVGTSEPAIALLRVSPTSGRTGATGDPLRGLVVSTVQPAQLVMESAAGGCLLVIGCAADPHQWMQDLRRAADSFPVQPGRENDAAAAIELTATWPYPAAREQAVKRILAEINSGAGRQYHAIPA